MTPEKQFSEREVSLQYRPLGETGLQVSMVGFGASPLGDVFGSVTQQGATDAVAAAIDHGINLFDVSPYYGLTLAEERLGKALGSRRGEVLLATKCGRYGAEDFDFSAATITREFESSLQRLKTDHVDLLQAHDIEFGDLDLIVTETLPAMRRLQQQGKARFIGITGYWPGQLARAARQVPVDTVLNYCHANLFCDDMDRELTPFAASSGVGLMNASPLHMGLLGGGNVPTWHPAPAEVKAAASDVVALCRQHGVEPAVLAMHLCLQHPTVASTFIGISSVGQVASSCASLDYQPVPELLAAVKARIAPVFNRVWPSGLLQNSEAKHTEAQHAGAAG